MEFFFFSARDELKRMEEKLKIANQSKQTANLISTPSVEKTYDAKASQQKVKNGKFQEFFFKNNFFFFFSLVGIGNSRNDGKGKRKKIRRRFN